MSELWLSVLETWHALTPEIQFLLGVVGALVGTLVAAWVIGSLVGHKLRAANFDAAFRRSWLPPGNERFDAHRLSPTFLVTGLVWLTVLGGGL